MTFVSVQSSSELSVRRRVLERQLLRTVAVQTTFPAQRASRPARYALGFGDIAVFAAKDFNYFQAAQLEKVGHSAPLDGPHQIPDTQKYFKIGLR